MPNLIASQSGAPISEVRLVHKLVKRVGRPVGIQSFEVEFGEDSTGDAAVWVWFSIRDDFPTSKSGIDKLNEFATSVRQELLGSKLNRVPYVRFRSENQPKLKRA
jgi:hypothetical protein